jgi:hypothetical protein
VASLLLLCAGARGSASLLLRLPDVALVLEDDGQRLGHEVLVEAVDVQQEERAGPVERLADARVLLQVELPDALDQRDDVPCQLLAHARDLELHDRELVGLVREVDVEVKAAALEGVGHLPGVVAREDDHRHVLAAQRAELGDAHLEVGQDLEQERLELGVGLVDLVDQQDDRLGRRDRAQQGARQQEAVAEEDVVLGGDLVDCFGERPGAADDLAELVLEDLRVEELLRVLPLVERLRLVEPLVALEPDELVAEGGRQDLRELGLPDAGRALHQNGLLQGVREVDDRADRPAGDVLERLEAGDDVVDGSEHGRVVRGTLTYAP